MIGRFALVLDLGYRGGPRGYWGQLVQARPGYASEAIISPIEPLNDADHNQVAVWGWNSSLFLKLIEEVSSSPRRRDSHEDGTDEGNHPTAAAPGS